MNEGSSQIQTLLKDAREITDETKRHPHEQILKNQRFSIVEQENDEDENAAPQSDSSAKKNVSPKKKKKKLVVSQNTPKGQISSSNEKDPNTSPLRRQKIKAHRRNRTPPSTVMLMPRPPESEIKPELLKKKKIPGEATMHRQKMEAGWTGREQAVEFMFHRNKDHYVPAEVPKKKYKNAEEEQEAEEEEKRQKERKERREKREKQREKQEAEKLRQMEAKWNDRVPFMDRDELVYLSDPVRSTEEEENETTLPTKVHIAKLDPKDQPPEDPEERAQWLQKKREAFDKRQEDFKMKQLQRQSEDYPDMMDPNSEYNKKRRRSRKKSLRQQEEATNGEKSKLFSGDCSLLFRVLLAEEQPQEKVEEGGKKNPQHQNFSFQESVLRRKDSSLNPLPLPKDENDISMMVAIEKFLLGRFSRQKKENASSEENQKEQQSSKDIYRRDLPEICKIYLKELASTPGGKLYPEISLAPKCFELLNTYLLSQPIPAPFALVMYAFEKAEEVRDNKKKQNEEGNEVVGKRKSIAPPVEKQPVVEAPQEEEKEEEKMLDVSVKPAKEYPILFEHAGAALTRNDVFRVLQFLSHLVAYHQRLALMAVGKLNPSKFLPLMNSVSPFTVKPPGLPLEELADGFFSATVQNYQNLLTFLSERRNAAEEVKEFTAKQQHQHREAIKKLELKLRDKKFAPDEKDDQLVKTLEKEKARLDQFGEIQLYHFINITVKNFEAMKATDAAFLNSFFECGTEAVPNDETKKLSIYDLAGYFAKEEIERAFSGMLIRDELTRRAERYEHKRKELKHKKAKEKEKQRKQAQEELLERQRKRHEGEIDEREVKRTADAPVNKASSPKRSYEKQITRGQKNAAAPPPKKVPRKKAKVIGETQYMDMEEYEIPDYTIRLKQIFEAVVSGGHPLPEFVGHPPPIEVDGSKLSRLLKECELLDKVTLSQTDFDLIFNKVKNKGERKIRFQQFLSGVLPAVAAKKEMAEEDVQAIIVEYGNTRYPASEKEQEADRMAKEEAERKAKEEADRKAEEEADRKAKEEAERKVKEEAAKEEADRKAKEEADRKAKKEADRKAKEEADRKVNEEADRKVIEEAERMQKEETEGDRRAREEADQEEADRIAKEEAELQAKNNAVFGFAPQPPKEAANPQPKTWYSMPTAPVQKKNVAEEEEEIIPEDASSRNNTLEQQTPEGTNGVVVVAEKQEEKSGKKMKMKQQEEHEKEDDGNVDWLSTSVVFKKDPILPISTMPQELLEEEEPQPTKVQTVKQKNEKDEKAKQQPMKGNTKVAFSGPLAAKEKNPASTAAPLAAKKTSKATDQSMQGGVKGNTKVALASALAAKEQTGGKGQHLPHPPRVEKSDGGKILQKPAAVPPGKDKKAAAKTKTNGDRWYDSKATVAQKNANANNKKIPEDQEEEGDKDNADVVAVTAVPTTILQPEGQPHQHNQGKHPDFKEEEIDEGQQQLLSETTSSHYRVATPTRTPRHSVAAEEKEEEATDEEKEITKKKESDAPVMEEVIEEEEEVVVELPSSSPKKEEEEEKAYPSQDSDIAAPSSSEKMLPITITTGNEKEAHHHHQQSLLAQISHLDEDSSRHQLVAESGKMLQSKYDQSVDV